MRLTREQAQIIREESRNTFGPDAVVRLFGSRTDDRRRGGDIDLHIETSLPRAKAQRAANRLYASLIRRLGEQRIDIVTHSAGTPLKRIDDTASRTGIRL